MCTRVYNLWPMHIASACRHYWPVHFMPWRKIPCLSALLTCTLHALAENTMLVGTTDLYTSCPGGRYHACRHYWPVHFMPWRKIPCTTDLYTSCPGGRYRALLTCTLHALAEDTVHYWPVHFMPWRKMPCIICPHMSQNEGPRKLCTLKRWGTSILNLSRRNYQERAIKRCFHYQSSQWTITLHSSVNIQKVDINSLYAEKHFDNKSRFR